MSTLPLDSPYWSALSAGRSADRARDLVRSIVDTGRLDPGPLDELTDEMLHQGSVYDVAYAALPYLVDVATARPPAELSEFWVGIGSLLAEGPARYGSPPPVPGLQAGLDDAVRRAASLAPASFLAAEHPDGITATEHALACLALRGHPAGVSVTRCGAWGGPTFDIRCPRSGTWYRLDDFTDPVAPPVDPPPVPELPPNGDPGWQALAAALRTAAAAAAAAGPGPGWDGYLEVAAAVAAGGCPVRTPPREIWCLVSMMVAVVGEVEWGRTLARLVGWYGCADCGEPHPLGAMMDDGQG